MSSHDKHVWSWIAKGWIRPMTKWVLHSAVLGIPVCLFLYLIYAFIGQDIYWFLGQGPDWIFARLTYSIFAIILTLVAAHD